MKEIGDKVIEHLKVIWKEVDSIINLLGVKKFDGDAKSGVFDFSESQIRKPYEDAE